MKIHAHHYRLDRIGLNSIILKGDRDKIIVELAAHCKIRVSEMVDAWKRIEPALDAIGEGTAYIQNGSVNVTVLDD